MNRIQKEWSRRVVAEYRSAAITSQTVHWMIQIGLAEELIQVGLRIVGDELAHARLSHEACIALGGPTLPKSLPLEVLSMPKTEGLWYALVDSILKNFCLGESFAVPLFEAMRRNASNHAVIPILTRVLQDEAVHRAFGWSTLDALLTIDSSSVIQRAAEKVPLWIEETRISYGANKQQTSIPDEEQAAGLLAGAEYAEIVENTYKNVILPWFRKRNIEISNIV